VPALLTWWKLDIGELAPAAHGDAVEAIGADLIRRLDEEHRRYHTARHVVEMYGAIEELEREGVVGAREATLARVAACFHDAVYDPAAVGGANEADSAALAVRALRSLGLAPEDIDRVRRLVLDTEQHDAPVTEGLAAAFHDADLWILAAPSARFDEYCAQVREEYAAVPDGAYAAGRTAVLERFLRRDTIYATRHGRRTWGEPARVNLAREMARLADLARPGS
jgi:predicted metal-dependent HD superfamily phosphohydrolase